jgi:hypothetical protein
MAGLKAKSNRHVKSGGRVDRLLWGLQRCEMIAPIAKDSSRFSERLTTSANQLW